MMVHSVTALLVSYKTCDLTSRSVESFLEYYPGVRLLLIDNGSQDESAEYIKHISGEYPNVYCILNKTNIYHGPALDQGILACKTRYIFTLDSDCEVKEGGFLEEMLKFFIEPELYALGMLQYVNNFGYATRRHAKGRILYIHPHAMLLDKEKYLCLPPFIHHGAPCVKNMRAVEKSGYSVKDFPIEKYVLHHWNGTSSRYGYGLGPTTYLRYLLNKILQGGKPLEQPERTSTRISKNTPNH